MGSVGRLRSRGIGLVLLGVGVVTLGADLRDAGLKKECFRTKVILPTYNIHAIVLRGLVVPLAEMECQLPKRGRRRS